MTGAAAVAAVPDPPPKTAPPPPVVEAERWLLAACMQIPGATTTAGQHVNAAAFHDPAHGALFDALQAIDGTPDPITVAYQLRRSPEPEARTALALLPRIYGLPVVAANVGHYARIVAQAAVKRHCEITARRLAQAATLADPAVFRDQLTQVTDRLAGLAAAWDKTTGGGGP